jgi:hypothetical protein
MKSDRYAARAQMIAEPSDDFTTMEQSRFIGLAESFDG